MFGACVTLHILFESWAVAETGPPFFVVWHTRGDCVGVESVSKGRDAVSLSRDLHFFDITMIGMGAMIGAGIFVLTGAAAGVAGPALVAAFLLNGVVTSFTAMSYAELGSAFPEAGGGYLWVKRGLGGANGFLSGWMSWFAHAVAGSLYGVGFGRFATELWMMAGLPTFGASVGTMTLVFTTLVIVVFTAINYLGASETGTVGNVITVAKIVILLLFVISGLTALGRTPEWYARFSQDFLPNGVGGVLIAMGLTFIAFEGYEIIAQSGEEVVNPKRNIPRAIFTAIVLVVFIYVAVAFVAIGAIQPPADDVAPHEYLSEKGEVAIVEAARQFMPAGAVLLLISGLASTMSALNATTYSSSRVSFAMGRDRNLPTSFSRIHPGRHTPYLAVVFSGALMVFMAWALPLESLATAADIMFLLLFFQVNIVVMVLRRNMPDLERGFLIPWFPWVPILGLVSNLALAVYLFTYRPIAWVVAVGWIVVGLLAYFVYFSKKEAMAKPSEILHEEVLVSREYSVLVPVATQEQARILGQIGAAIAADHGGEVLALHVAQVPPQLSLADGRYFLKEGREHLEMVIGQARAREVPVHTMIRLGRKVADAVRHTAEESASDLIVLEWPGTTSSAGRVFGSVIDPIVDNPPTDIALVCYRGPRSLRSVLVPVAGGPNNRRAVQLAVSMARQEDGAAQPARVMLLHVLPPGAREAARIRGQQAIRYATNGLRYPRIEHRLVEAPNPLEGILGEAAAHDLVVIGATDEPLFQNILFGSLAEQVARRAPVTVIVVKRRSGPLHNFLRQTVLEPSSGDGGSIHA
jgi:amino acid transporter/nucleotide-binding universal stress UspA family protein